MPDLLSTAVALHALSGMNVDFEPIKESCLDYVDTLWINNTAVTDEGVKKLQQALPNCKIDH